ncbi:MFS transporter [Helicobacter sp. MIT 21-1697]|uniref:MFS transporter n=1 Tax=Helicobacter sp. MIT 21-1697 TaxID=2993733 RepID=UPI00224AC28A|nr:MFS transporter [Helicobacter sp. MIT 21-1697]MCX2717696.1 MFS transporter [Helicobacter sp. MIT 21-1697]
MSKDTSAQKQSLPDTFLFQVTLFATASMTVLGGTIIAPSLPHFEEHFAGVPHIDMLSRLVLTLPALFIMIFAPISGFLLDKYGRLRFLYPSIFLWSVSGACGFFLEASIYWILISRAIFGIATAFVMTAVSALIGDYYQGAKRERALGLQGFFMAGGGAVFLVLGGVLSDIDWRYPFLVYLSGFIILILAFIMLFEPKRNASKSDVKAVNFSFFKFAPIYLFSFYAMSMFYVMPTQIPHFITHNLNKSGNLIGISLAVSSLCTAILSLFYARLRARLSVFLLYFVSLSAIGGGFLLIGMFQSYEILIFALVLVGSGLGIILVNNSSWLLSVAGEYERAKAAGFLSASVFMGQFCSPFITQPLVRLGDIPFMLNVNGVILLVSAVIFLCWHFVKKR